MDLDRRATFVMFEIDGLPCDQIAVVSGVALGTVYLRWHAERAAERARGSSEARTDGAEAGARAAEPAPGRSVESAATRSSRPRCSAWTRAR